MSIVRKQKLVNKIAISLTFIKIFNINKKP